MECNPWPPPKRDRTLYLAIASSILSVEETLELKTIKAGAIARLASIYRVDSIIVYRDRHSSLRDHKTMKLLLEYAATPPHLRRKLIPLRRELRAVGLIPPLRLPGHDLPEKPVKGLVMEGVVESCTKEWCNVYLGRYGVGRLPRGDYRVGDRIVVEIIDPGKLLLRDARDTRIYLGYKVKAEESLPRLLARLRRRGFFIVGTSRKGECLRSQLLEAITSKDRVLLVFSGPRGDVRIDADPSLYDIIINTIPVQGTRTVRTEEAVAATLSLLNAYEWMKIL